MADEIFDRAYRSGRAELHGAINRAFASIGRGLGAMHRFEWSAPWSPRDKNGGKDVGIA